MPTPLQPDSRRAKLEELARICRSGTDLLRPPPLEPGGLIDLQSVLPGGGWPIGAIVELMPAVEGIGEMRLILPALARITQSGRYVGMVSPPYIPYAPALEQHGLRLDRVAIMRARTTLDTLWTFEQALRCESFGAVLAWPATIANREIRRLQLAAEAGRNVGFLYRPSAAAQTASPAAVRLRLHPAPVGSIRIEVMKCRGGHGTVTALCRLDRTTDSSPTDAPCPSTATDTAQSAP